MTKDAKIKVEGAKSGLFEANTPSELSEGGNKPENVYLGWGGMICAPSCVHYEKCNDTVWEGEVMCETEYELPEVGTRTRYEEGV